MKKVLVMGLTSILGGIETYIYNLIRFINKDDITFDFLLIDETKNAVFQSELTELLGEGHFFNAPSLKKNPFKAIKWLHRFYKEHNYNVIYLNTSTSARAIYCSYAIKKCNTKLILHSHNGSASSSIRGVNNRLFRHYTTKKSTIRLACSEVAYKWMFDDFPTDNIIIPNGIDTERFKFNQMNRDSVRKELNIEDKYVIGHVGRFSTQKNHKFFIELAKKLDARYIFMCIGDGDRKDELLASIKSQGLEKKFIILSVAEDVEKYYSAMDIFAMPSLFEGLPIVAVEAQCAGLECLLSSNVSEQTNITGHCEFISLDNIPGWTEKIETVYQRYDGREILNKSGFSIYNTAKLIYQIITGMKS